MEHCLNPWKQNCTGEDIKVYIQLNGENLPICKACWQKIADSDKEWGTETQTTITETPTENEETDE